MTDLNEYLAVEVMGWELDNQLFEIPCYLPNDKAGNAIWRKDWNPRGNIEQAMMCADTFHRFVVGKGRPGKKKQYSAAVKPFDAPPSSANGVTLAEAISLACARAKGWSE